MDAIEAATRIVEAIIAKGGVSLGEGNGRESLVKSVGAEAGVIYAEVHAAVVAASKATAAAAGPPRTSR